MVTNINFMWHKNFLTLLFFVIISLCNAQVLDRYPIDSQFYQGGRTNFYKEFHQLLLDKKIPQCSNKNEYLNLKLVVYPDSTIKLVKQDSALITKAKCTYDASREVLRYMKNWIPAEINGEKHPAIVTVQIYMDDLYEKYTDSYLPENYTTQAEFKDGIMGFRKEVANAIDVNRFQTNSAVIFSLEVNFEIDQEGKMQNVELARETDNKDFNNMILQSIRSIKKKWKPAMFHNIPIKSHFRLPLSFNFE
ncbi:energy transducer TonB [Chryseobacterium defluvii]|uniref:TonB-like protein n=1 Tax=Chryseobacterium defluvii TaxID=160396 RepID=A0A495SBS6_9FLAO|nr:hypothetical protein [Chryseobacterium defluvii]RKS96734.1 TonB-like protein [Chryseobacterium defluvii]